MELRDLGKTGLKVTRLGLGLAEVPRHATSADVEVTGRVLNATLDGGINFIDTAACYGSTEEHIGRTIAHRRDDYVLATKCGHVVGEAAGQPWTPQTIEESIDRSLKRMRTDHLDLVQLHSCDLDVLEQGEAIKSLVKARESGKARFIGYSGDNEAARWAVDSGLFDALQTSLNIADQHARDELLKRAGDKGVGILIKRPIANGVWGRAHSTSPYGDEYFRRARVMAGMGPMPGAPEDPVLLALGFVFAHPEVDTVLVGTHNPSHVLSNIELVEQRLPISVETVEELHRRFDAVGGRWPQLT